MSIMRNICKKSMKNKSLIKSEVSINNVFIKTTLIPLKVFEKQVPLTIDINTSNLPLHTWLSVDLAHVAAAVFCPERSDSQLPSAGRVQVHGVTRAKDHAVVEGEDGLVFGSEPAHLSKRSK